MTERQVTGIKFDIDRKEARANVKYNKMPNCQNEDLCKTENFTYFYNE